MFKASSSRFPRAPAVAKSISWMVGVAWGLAACATQPKPTDEGERVCVPKATTPSGLPVPCAASKVAKPAGASGNLRVLDWAGFKSAVTYTFDDGQPSHIEHYQALQATGVRMTFFVTSANQALPGFVETFRRAVRDGHEIGNHSAHHCHADLRGCLSGAAGGSLAAEIDDCTRLIKERLGQSDVWTAASPYGDSGYAGAFSARSFLNRGIYAGTVGPVDGTDPFQLPTYIASPEDSPRSFNRAIDGARGKGAWLLFLVHTLSPTDENWYSPIPVSLVTRSVAHALSLGDVWVDSMVNVGAYWRGQSIVATTAPALSRDTMTWTWTLPDHFPPGKYLRVVVDGGTLSQAGQPLAWDEHGYYEVSLDKGTLTLMP
jgi:peptidoglycan/xylan/chitin deacetylase (PgdA/CDA1 family)